MENFERTAVKEYEREVAIGWVADEDFVRIDIDYGGKNDSYIRLCDEAVAEGRGKLVAEDNYHKSYHINKDVFNFFTKKYKRNLTDEQRAEMSARLSAVRRSKN